MIREGNPEGTRAIPLFLDPLKLTGEHNRLNLLAAAPACRCYGMQVALIAPAFHLFQSIEHRLVIDY